MYVTLRLSVGFENIGLLYLVLNKHHSIEHDRAERIHACITVLTSSLIATPYEPEIKEVAM